MSESRISQRGKTRAHRVSRKTVAVKLALITAHTIGGQCVQHAKHAKQHQPQYHEMSRLYPPLLNIQKTLNHGETNSQCFSVRHIQSFEDSQANQPPLSAVGHVRSLGVYQVDENRRQLPYRILIKITRVLRVPTSSRPTKKRVEIVTSTPQNATPRPIAPVNNRNPSDLRKIDISVSLAHRCPPFPSLLRGVHARSPNSGNF